MEANGRRIEIFEPFGQAFELMKKILFQPFDLKKWFVIGFAAFIAGSWGSGINFNPFTHNFNAHSRSITNGVTKSADHLAVWAIPLIITGAALGIAIVLLLVWIVSRGRFVFTDCIVRNRAAIAEPWREYRREGNSYFLFSIGLALAAIVIIAALALVFLVPLGLFGSHSDGAALGIGMVCVMVALFCIWIVCAIYLAIVVQLMVPVMYRRRCTAVEAFRDVAGLVLRFPGPFILFVLFGIVLAVGLMIISTMLACATCCIGSLPYISTVLLLPAFIWLRGFMFYFLRQFGPDYDVWYQTASPDTGEPPIAPSTPLPPPALA
ncbi:MAG: hypothetical protein ABI944_00835 [Chthoniobacterales bacterium]